MSVQTQQFRVVGVDKATGQDISAVIDAATKAAAEVKAEQMNIETTHIVRLKQDEPAPPDDHELFSAEAAEALTAKRTDKLIEEVAPPEEPRIAPALTPPPDAAPQPAPLAPAVARPAYNASNTRGEPAAGELSGLRVFSFVLLFLLALCGGAYFVLVHEPNAVKADTQELVFGDDLFTDVIHATQGESANTPVRDAFTNRVGAGAQSDQPILAEAERLVINPPQDQAAAPDGPARPVKLVLQSVVTSHEGRFAVINGKLYKQGSAVMGHTLLNVADDWVLLEADGTQRVLQIESQGP